ncbi:Oidioi.mRNA.OKI2018_I69.chr1.g8.t1.cds [Oikopleura dioica]|uniref:Oidioi.mRNA.OKI2018_I69.chr1.g8.t1.cds n=1 Tax=Oikopleura dioica TaxID=34765 RepID=A0ABN7SIJ6_OIKDI|nr:Oidioi.mRNA.OKI2018_I69.chr1.g8.t1.cds [Oikopleura dioica]
MRKRGAKCQYVIAIFIYGFIGLLFLHLITNEPVQLSPNEEDQIQNMIINEMKEENLLDRTIFEDPNTEIRTNEFENCNDDEPDIFLNLTLLEENYPELRGQRQKIEGKCIYPDFPYLNQMIRFNKHLKPAIIQEPNACDFQDPSLTSLIFGIKSIPGAIHEREILRRTWLRKDIWKKIGFEIKIVFITGNDKDLEEEANIKEDLLILDSWDRKRILKFLRLIRLDLTETKKSNEILIMRKSQFSIDNLSFDVSS